MAVVDNNDWILWLILWQAMQQNHQGIEKKSVEDPAPRDTKKKAVASKLMQSCAQLTQVHQYRCPPGSSHPYVTGLVHLEQTLAKWNMPFLVQTVVVWDLHLTSRWFQHTVEPSLVVTHWSIRASCITTQLSMNTKQISDGIMARLVKAKHHKNIPYNRFKGSSLDDILVMAGL